MRFRANEKFITLSKTVAEVRRRKGGIVVSLEGCFVGWMVGRLAGEGEAED